MSVPAPDPHRVRAASLEQLRRLDLPTPPAQFPLIWEPGDEVELRPPSELEGRAAILNVVYAKCYGMSSEAAMAWLLDAHLLDQLSKPEWSFLTAAEDVTHPSFTLHLEAIYALAWLLGLVPELIQTEPAPGSLMEKLPHLPSRESFMSWRDRANPMVAPAPEAAAGLDLIYCLDWAYVEAERRRIRLPGLIDSRTIAQRRWALEWAVLFHGPYQEPPVDWEDINLEM